MPIVFISAIIGIFTLHQNSSIVYESRWSWVKSKINGMGKLEILQWVASAILGQSSIYFHKEGITFLI